MNVRRTLQAAALGLVIALPGLGGCNTGGGPSQMLEPTKPRMDREKETDRPAPTTPATPR